MEDKHMKEFSLSAFLLVTGFCFFFFSKVLFALDRTDLPLFTWIGVVAIIAGSISSIRSLVVKPHKK